MALQDSIETVAEWEEFFVKKLKLSTSTAQAYATSLFNEGYCEETVRRVLENTPPDQPSPTLSKLGIKAGHCLKMAVHMLPNQSSSSDHRSKIKIPRPTLTLDVNQVDFDQFCFEWRTYRTHYNIRSNEIASHLFYCGDEEVRKRIRLEKPSFTSSSEHTETELINILKGIVLSKVSKIVHIKQFYGLQQNTNESCNNYLIRLQTKASCCGFDCEPCAKERLKEQFIIGLAHKTIQTALLKTESIKPGTSLDVLLREALTLEQSLNDQISLKRQSEYLCAMETISQDTSGDEEHVKALGKASWNNKNDKAARLCSGCGSYGHSSFERQTLCPAWGKSCFNCGTRNHFSKCCRSKKASSNLQSGSAQLLEMTCMTVESSKSKLLRVMVQPKIPKKKSALYDILVFPDTGSSICLLGPKQLNALGLIRKDISPYISNVSVAGGSYIRTVGRFNVSIHIQGRTTEQVVYFSMKADRFILSRQACIALGVVPSTFPYPPAINACGNCSNVASHLGNVEFSPPNLDFPMFNKCRVCSKVAPSQTRRDIQYHETPIKHVGQSLSQLPFHRNLRWSSDGSAHSMAKQVMVAADKREEALRERETLPCHSATTVQHVYYLKFPLVQLS